VTDDLIGGDQGEINMARIKKPTKKEPEPASEEPLRLYTLEVFIIGGPITDKFIKKNPVISRTIQIRGDQTLQDLHHAIFDAFGRWEEHTGNSIRRLLRATSPKSRRTWNR
jgi:hypothetical protein